MKFIVPFCAHRKVPKMREDVYSAPPLFFLSCQKEQAPCTRQHKLHIICFRLAAKTHSLRCASSPQRNRFAGFRRGLYSLFSDQCAFLYPARKTCTDSAPTPLVAYCVPQNSSYLLPAAPTSQKAPGAPGAVDGMHRRYALRGCIQKGAAAPYVGRFKGVIVKRGKIEIPTLDCSLVTFSHEKVTLPSAGETLTRQKEQAGCKITPPFCTSRKYQTFYSRSLLIPLVT